MTAIECLALGTKLLTGKVPLPQKETYLILQRLLNFSTQSELLLKLNDIKLNDNQTDKFIDQIERRAKLEPMAYILGSESFYDKNFYVNKHVLIPRPETEFIIDDFQKHISPQESFRALDLCTGSGIIAIILASLYPNSSVYASDISRSALNIAYKNNISHHTNVAVIQADLTTGFKANCFDYILCNPPYIPYTQQPELQKDILNHEPHLALFSDNDGLQHISRLIPPSFEMLRPNGSLYLEIGINQSKTVTTLLQDNGFTKIREIIDFRQIPRILIATK